jgi:hypothetical protein
MDEPAPLTQQTSKPRPTALLRTWIFGVLTVLGGLFIGLSVYCMDAGFPPFAIGGAVGAGGSLLALGGMMLFHRPGR